MQPPLRPLTAKMLDASLRVRLHGKIQQRTFETLRAYLGNLLEERGFPPYRGHSIDVDIVASDTGIGRDVLLQVRPLIQPICDAICRAAAGQRRPRKRDDPDTAAVPESAPARGRPASRVERPGRAVGSETPQSSSAELPPSTQSLRFHMARHGDSLRTLHNALASSGSAPCFSSLAHWRRGTTKPSTPGSMIALEAIERRYGLPKGHFRTVVADRPHVGKIPGGLTAISPAERRRLAWHLPHDFGARPADEQQEILTWVREVVISGSTDYRRFQTAASKQRYAIRFHGLRTAASGRGTEVGSARTSCLVDAPATLQSEMADLLRFKTAALAPRGLRRAGVWNTETASQKVEHFALMFGALAANPAGEIGGAGVALESFTLAMLVFPAVWDWYLSWRERRRGFFTKWEAGMLAVILSLVKTETGWLRQTPRLADHLVTVPGFVSADDIVGARADWNAACDTMHKHGRSRIKEIERASRVHRDPFEPILPILEAASPLAEYRKITEEIVRLMPNENLYPRSTAEAVRSFLLLRLGLHLGLRQRNLRELLVCPRGRVPSSEHRLEELKRGELRWSVKDAGWEVLIPAAAFKNAHSSFFGSRPFRLVLPDLGCLYKMIEAWIDRHRDRLIGPADDPGTFFVKTVKMTSTSAAYNKTTFYEAWRLTIQRYGVYNPYTGRGAIANLLPHGPHNIRDVLATHILKQTGSYEQASYAIQDTPEMIAMHYGRFLPQDKAAIAAKILNQVWAAA